MKKFYLIFLLLITSTFANAQNYVWAKNVGSTSDDQASNISVDGLGNCYLTGYFQGTADFDPGVATANLTSAGVQDVFFTKYSQPVGIDENSLQSIINIYPNPASNNIIIENRSITPQNFVVSIENIQGQQIVSEKINLITTHTMDVSNLSDGIYFLNMQNEKDNFVSKVVVQH
jgi:hypothetical protein